jgi:hypothetical protein
MAYIRPLTNGNFRAFFSLKGIVKNKTFPTESLAQAWAETIEHIIKTIPNLDQLQLLALSDDDNLFNRTKKRSQHQSFQQCKQQLIAKRER